MPSIISVENLGKHYRIRRGAPRSKYIALRDIMAQKLTSLFRPASKSSDSSGLETFWALKNVSFEVNEGEVLGIVGHNGAGKSTLLKILSRITEPAEGRITLRGRVASLLEVGTGFHPELTGRENIYLNAALLGMKRHEVQSRFDEIVAFANVERFLDTPVKRYSSGMQTRLGFAVAAHLEPEILIVDEVLAVGDHEFQKRCLGKMQEVSQSGRTVLFVSHNMNTLGTLTTRCIHLHRGNIINDGPTSQVVANYLSTGNENSALYESQERDSTPKVLRVEVRTSKPGGIHSLFEPLEFHFQIWCPHPIRGACLSFAVNDLTRLSTSVNPWIFDSEQPFARSAGVHHLVCRMPKPHLFVGNYSLNVNFSEPPGGVKFEQLKGVCSFQIECVGRQRLDYPFEIGEACFIEDCEWQANTAKDYGATASA